MLFDLSLSTISLTLCQPDIVDIKPANMEELTEVITAAQFHPTSCHMLIYSSSKGTIRLCDMREKALCDEHAKRESLHSLVRVRRGRGRRRESVTKVIRRKWE